MSTSPLAVADPLHRRLGGWLQERFPPVTYTLLVAVFGVAGLAVGAASGGHASGVLALPVVWLFLLHLRVFDEHKDHVADARAYPERLLSRGVVTLPLLARLGAIAIAVQLVGALLLGRAALLAWAGSLLFSVAMRYEFGVGGWLSRHIVLYALSHNPVTAGLALILVLGTGAPLGAAAGWFALQACLAMLSFELARKTRLPHEEIPTVPSYTTELGQGGARSLLLGAHVLTGIALAALISSLGREPALAAGAAVVAVAPGALTSIGRQRGKRVELGASLSLVLGFASVALLAGGAP